VIPPIATDCGEVGGEGLFGLCHFAFAKARAKLKKHRNAELSLHGYQYRTCHPACKKLPAATIR
jgi:hypothetical protein